MFEVVCNPSYDKMFAVMRKCEGFWQQVGHRYTYKKNAEKAMKRYQAIEEIKQARKA